MDQLINDLGTGEKRLLQVIPKIYRNINDFYKLENPRDPISKTHPGQYNFLTRPIGQIITQLYLVEKFLIANNKGRRFVDAGSGYGNVMQIARCFDFDVWGIENNQDYIDNIPDEFIKSRTIYGDIFDQLYDYDVVYSFHPFSDPIQEARWEAFILKAPGIIIGNDFAGEDNIWLV
jgi:hypothetical protein